MVLITEDLIRKKAEHNEKIISSLEELSLHQCDIEKIEYLDKWCRDLQILYLQSNLIAKIENLGRLKKVKYINLALNNIEIIENLEGCESLEKLDLTVNFIGTLTCVERLKANEFLQELYLTGNPVTEFEGYRDFVIATLPKLKKLDGVDVEKSERIVASQSLSSIRPVIVQQETNYQRKRQRERKAAAGQKEKHGTDWYSDTQKAKIVELEDCSDEDLTDAEKQEKFWNEPSDYTPESRLAIHDQLKKQKEKDNPEKPKPEKKRTLETPDGRILNINEPKVDFTFNEDDENVMIDIGLFKFMDTSLCDVDVQPTYVKVWIKGQLLQLTLPEEVKPDSSAAKRSQTTGHLLLTMPKLNPVVRPPQPKVPPKLKQSDNKENKKKIPEKLEIDPQSRKNVDIANIVQDKKVSTPLGSNPWKKSIVERENSDNFVDNDDVPPLM